MYYLQDEINLSIKNEIEDIIETNIDKEVQAEVSTEDKNIQVNIGESPKTIKLRKKVKLLEDQLNRTNRKIAVMKQLAKVLNSKLKLKNNTR